MRKLHAHAEAEQEETVFVLNFAIPLSALMMVGTAKARLTPIPTPHIVHVTNRFFITDYAILSAITSNVKMTGLIARLIQKAVSSVKWVKLEMIIRLQSSAM